MIIPRTTKLGAALVLAAALGWAPIASAQVPKYTPLLPATQLRFTLDLPVPVDYVPNTTQFPGFDYYEVQMSPVTQLPLAFPQGAACPAGTQWLGLTNAGVKVCTPVWGYSQTNGDGLAGNPSYALNGLSTYPSMNFRATKGTPVKVKWVNNAPDQHLFCPFPLDATQPCAIDRTLMGVLGAALPNAPGGQSYGGPMQADNAMVVHLHGGEIPPDSDGFAELWFGNANSNAAYPPAAFPTVPVANSSFGALQNIEPVFDTSLTTSNGVEVGNLVRPTTNSMVYNYPMVQAGATIWYHDHALGKTRINVAAGPAGFFFIEDPAVETSLYATGALPPRGDCSVAGATLNGPTAANPLGNPNAASACFDIPIAVQDRAFNTDGSINFPNGLGQAPPVGAIAPWPAMTAAELAAWNAGLTPGPNRDHPQWVPEYFGDMAVVNGVIWPKIKVEPRPYRFRLLDGSNARCYELSMKSATLLTVPRWNIVASDQGYLPAPTTVKTLVMCPGERYDVVVDFSGIPAGTLIRVSNSASAPYPAGIKPGGNSIYAFMGDVMQFVVVPATNAPAPAPWVKPVALVAKTPLPAVAKQRQMVLNEVLDPVTLAPLRVQIDGKAFETAVTETPKRGTVEQWTIVNTTVDAHPMHLHLVQFEVVSRQSFDLAGFTAVLGATNPALPVQNYNLAASVTPFLKGKPRAPEPGETGWKDTARSYPGEVLTVRAKWDGGWQDFPVCLTTPPLMAVPPAGNATCSCAPDPLAPTTCLQPEQPVFNTAINYWEPVTAGPYVWHCHIVDHEDNEMMRPALVIP